MTSEPRGASLTPLCRRLFVWLDKINYNRVGRGLVASPCEASAADLHAWFQGETALAQLIPSVAKRMSAADDPALKAVAYGIARCARSVAAA